MRKYSLTTKGSSREISRRKRLTQTVIVLILAVLALLILPRLFGFIAATIYSPVLALETYLTDSTATIPNYFKDRNSLTKQIAELEREVVENSTDAHLNRQLLAENEALRSLLQATSTTRIGASVIGRPSALPYDVFVIDRGSNDGIQAEAPVFIGPNQVIGFIAEVYAESAVAVLVTTPNVRSTVYVYGPNIYTTAVGQGGGVLRIGVPQGIELTEGDLAVLPAFDSGVYGAISSIATSPTQPEQYGFVTVDVPLSSIKFVSVGSVPLQSIGFDEAKEIVERVRIDITQVPVPAGVLVDISTSTATTTATSTNTGLE